MIASVQLLPQYAFSEFESFLLNVYFIAIIKIMEVKWKLDCIAWYTVGDKWSSVIQRNPVITLSLKILFWLVPQSHIIGLSYNIYMNLQSFFVKMLVVKTLAGSYLHIHIAFRILVKFYSIWYIFLFKKNALYLNSRQYINYIDNYI